MPVCISTHLALFQNVREQVQDDLLACLLCHILLRRVCICCTWLLLLLPCKQAVLQHLPG